MARIVILEEPYLALVRVDHHFDSPGHYAEFAFRTLNGERVKERISLNDIFEGKATHDLFCRGFLPPIVGSDRPSVDNMVRLDASIVRAIYEWAAQEKAKPQEPPEEPPAPQDLSRIPAIVTFEFEEE